MLLADAGGEPRGHRAQQGERQGRAAMKDHPVLFRARMVKALLAETKTQTRRPIQRVERQTC
jgi:hypothetical protein